MRLIKLSIVTSRVAKVMFSQACVTSTPGGGGGGAGGRWATPKVYHFPPGTRSQHLPPPSWDQVTTPPPWDQVTTPPPPSWDHVTTPPSPRDQVTTPPSPPLWDQVITTPPPQDYVHVGGTHPTGMHSCFKSNREEQPSSFLQARRNRQPKMIS